ncbi:MAG: hypothetical protein Q4F72_09585 [Desulfovibrionaceae bacterium]|nr:hypothetical protein [Desulfovibrionaceae bacterium]
MFRKLMAVMTALMLLVPAVCLAAGNLELKAREELGDVLFQGFEDRDTGAPVAYFNVFTARLDDRSAPASAFKFKISLQLSPQGNGVMFIYEDTDLRRAHYNATVRFGKGKARTMQVSTNITSQNYTIFLVQDPADSDYFIDQCLKNRSVSVSIDNTGVKGKYRLERLNKHLPEVAQLMETLRQQ